MILARLLFACLAGVWTSFAVVADGCLGAGFTILAAVCGIAALYCRKED